MLSVTTKTGDRGESGLANGQRLPKDALIFEVLGVQDELNSWLGLSIAKLSDHFQKEKDFLLETQDNLFYVGAELARSPQAKLPKSALTKLERHSENLQKKMADNWTIQFLYPGGTEAAAVLDLARTVSRRFERTVVHYSRELADTAEPKKKIHISPIILQYVNRLSDYLFVLRCFVNQEEKFVERKFHNQNSYAQKLRRKLTRKK